MADQIAIFGVKAFVVFAVTVVLVTVFVFFFGTKREGNAKASH